MGETTDLKPAFDVKERRLEAHRPAPVAETGGRVLTDPRIDSLSSSCAFTSVDYEREFVVIRLIPDSPTLSTAVAADIPITGM
jgi:hypothetical protein